MASLLEQLQRDVSAIHEVDFGVPMQLTSPGGATATVTGLCSDVGRRLEPGSGLPLQGRQVHVSLTLAALSAAGIGVPDATGDGSRLPWRLTFNGQTFAVVEVDTDRTLGVVSCKVEVVRA